VVRARYDVTRADVQNDTLRRYYLTDTCKSNTTNSKRNRRTHVLMQYKGGGKVMYNVLPSYGDRLYYYITVRF